VQLLNEAAVAALVRTALLTVRREYPHKLDQELNADTDLKPPRVLNPSFFGSYDWHSAVHSHWTIVRSLRRGLPADLAADAVAILDDHLAVERIRAEAMFFESRGGRRSERPYGWAWLLLLHAECSATGVRQDHPWGSNLEPLAKLLKGRLIEYFTRELEYPIRSGTHGNTAFSLHLMLKAARNTGDLEMEQAVRSAALGFYFEAGPRPWDNTPSGTDFLSPALAEAALLADLLEAHDLALWLGRAGIESAQRPWSPPSVMPDDSDASGAHLEGLLVTRAWSLATIAQALNGSAAEASEVSVGLAAHLEAVRRIRPSEGFHRAHWLPTFLVYLDDQLDDQVADRADHGNQ